MNKNTSYYKAMFAKSEAASPLSKIYGTTHNKKMGHSAMEMSHMKKRTDKKAKGFHGGMAKGAAGTVDTVIKEKKK